MLNVMTEPRSKRTPRRKQAPQPASARPQKITKNGRPHRRLKRRRPAGESKYQANRDWSWDRFSAIAQSNVIPVMDADALLEELEHQLARPLRNVLFDQVVDFLRITGISPTRFGVEAALDEKILFRIGAAPNGISLDKADHVREYMADHLRNMKNDNGGEGGGSANDPRDETSG